MKKFSRLSILVAKVVVVVVVVDEELVVITVDDVSEILFFVEVAINEVE